ncbi:MAG: Ig-like domain-containing protein [archaeon]
MDTNLTCNLTVDGTVNQTVYAVEGNSYNMTLNLSVQKAYTWRVTCIDEAENINSSATWSFSTDTGPPEIELQSPVAPNNWDDDGSVTFAYTADDSSRILNCSLIIDRKYNMSNQTAINKGGSNSFAVVNISQGRHNWTVNCTDEALSVGTASEEVFYVDLRSPNITLTYPAPGYSSANSTVRLNFTVTDNLAPYLLCNFTVNGTVRNGQEINTTNGSNANYTVSGLADGLFWWNVTCRDLVNRTNTSSNRNFTVNEKPTLQLGNPVNESRTSDSDVIFFYTPTDNSGVIANCTVILNGVRNVTNKSVAVDTENNITSRGLPDNQYNWSINCTDRAGNTGSSLVTKNVFVDTLGPYIELRYPGAGQQLNGDDVNFNWTPTDQWATNLTCNLTIDGQTNKSGLNVTSGLSVNWTVNNLMNGSHQWNVTCWDDLININTSQTRSFAITVPDLTMNSSDIVFNDTNPDENDTVAITATITNIGGSPASNVTVRFYDGLPSNGDQIGGNNSLYVDTQSTNSTTVYWNITLGYHAIWVTINQDGNVVEEDYTNNNLSRNISILRSIVNYPVNGSSMADSPLQLNFTLRDYTNNTINYTVFADGKANQSNTTADGNNTLANITFSEGSHTIVVEAYAANLSNGTYRLKNSSAVYVTIDRTAPFADFITANLTWYSDATPEISFNMSDALDSVLNYSVYVNGTVDVTGFASNATNASVNLTSKNNGTYLLFVEARDDAGNRRNTSGILVYVDTALPEPQISTLNNSNFSDATPEIEFNITDYFAPAINYTFFVNGGKNTNGSAANGSNEKANLSGLSDGRYNITLEALDRSGNRKNSSAIEILVDTTGPDITINNPTPNEVLGNTISIMTTITDDGIGRIDNASFTIINSSAQLIESGQLPAPQFDANWYSRSDIDNDSDTNYVNLTVFANDTLGNKANVTIRFIVDNKNPSIDIVYPDGDSVNSDFRLDIRVQNDHLVASEYNVTNSTGAIKTYNVNLSVNKASFNWTDLINISNATAYPEGAYTVSVWANDTVGNNRTKTAAFTIDRTPPNISLAAPAGGYNTSSQSVLFNFSVADNLDSTLSCNLTVNGTVRDSGFDASNGSYANRTVGSLSEGAQYWNVSCVDDAGNANTSISRVLTVDRTGPAIRLGDPVTGAYDDDGTIVFYYTPDDALTQTANCTLILNSVRNVTNTSVLEGKENNFTVYTLPENVYAWTVNCSDIVGNEGTNTSARTLYVDKSAPNVTILTANNTWYSDATPEISFNVTDNYDPVQNFTVYVNGGPNINGTANNATATYANLTALANGTYRIVVEALDEAGNRVNSSPITIYVDTAVPAISLFYPGNNSNVSANDVQFNFTVTDNLAAIIICNLTINGAVNVTYIYADNATPELKTVNDLAVGRHNWSIVCRDNASNIGSSYVYMFNVTPPDLFIQSANITFNVTRFEENANFTIIADIVNIGSGSATNVPVEFYDGDPDSGGTRIDGNRTIALLDSGQAQSVNITARLDIGTYDIYVILDRPNNVSETNESNNKAYRSIVVSSWSLVYGNVTGNFTVRDFNNNTILSWSATLFDGNTYAADSESSIRWSNISALGVDVGGSAAADDFEDLDRKLNTTGYADSVNSTYTYGGSPMQTITLLVINNNIDDVPVANSSGSTSFTTGILWDASDDLTDSEYNGSEDVLFVSRINRTKQGQYGIADFEMRVPSRLKSYYQDDVPMVEFFVELV